MAVLTPDDLADREAVRHLVARYADAVNRRAADELASLFVADGEWLVPGFGTTTGHEQISELLRTLLGNFEVLVQTVHQGVIEVDGDTASGRWYLSEVGIDKAGSPVHFVGVYQDRLARRDDGWAFVRRKFDFLFRQAGEQTLRGYAFPTCEY